MIGSNVCAVRSGTMYIIPRAGEELVSHIPNTHTSFLVACPRWSFGLCRKRLSSIWTTTPGPPSIKGESWLSSLQLQSNTGRSVSLSSHQPQPPQQHQRQDTGGPTSTSVQSTVGVGDGTGQTDRRDTDFLHVESGHLHLNLSVISLLALHSHG